MKLRQVVSESWLDEKKKMTTAEKKLFLEKVANYNSYSEAIYSKHNLIDVAKELAEIAKQAETLTLSECGDEFDSITVSRNMKELKGLSEQFAKSAMEAHTLRSRVTSLYEDMGRVLERYYKINDLKKEEKLPAAKSVDDFTPELANKGKAHLDTKLIPNRQDEEKLPGAKSVASGTPALPNKGTAKKETPKLPGAKSEGDDTQNLPGKKSGEDETKVLPKKTGAIPLKSLTPNLPKK